MSRWDFRWRFFHSQSAHAWLCAEGIPVGALLGLVVYGLYNYTNLAILDKWSSTLSIVDTLWGGVIFGLTTLIV